MVYYLLQTNNLNILFSELWISKSWYKMQPTMLFLLFIKYVCTFIDENKTLVFRSICWSMIYFKSFFDSIILLFIKRQGFSHLLCIGSLPAGDGLCWLLRSNSCP